MRLKAPSPRTLISPPRRVGVLTDNSLGSAATLAELYETLSPLERDFFNSLDSELAKVDQFFVARERDVQLKVSALREQLRSLEHHRKLFHVGCLSL